MPGGRDGTLHRPGPRPVAAAKLCAPASASRSAATRGSATGSRCCRAGDLGRAAAELPRRLHARRCGGPRRRSATSSSREYFGSDPRLRAFLAVALPQPEGATAAGADRGALGRPPPLLPRRHRRSSPRRLPVQERRGGDDRASRTSSASRSTSAAASSPATAWRTSSAASPTASSPSTPTRSSATPTPTGGSAPAARTPGSSRFTVNPPPSPVDGAPLRLRQRRLLALLQSPDAPTSRTYGPLVLLAAVPLAGADRALVGGRDHAARTAGEQGGGKAARYVSQGRPC